MIQLYKKYHVGYMCVGIALIVCMVVLMIWLGNKHWYALLLVFFPTILLIFANATLFTTLTSRKLTKEVLTLLSNCEANKYMSELKRLFEDKAKKGVIVSIYNSLLASGYAAIGDYDSIYECCQKITAKNYQFAKHQSMIEYYISKDQIGQAQNEIEELRKKAAKMKNPKIKEASEINIRNAEYVIRIKQGNYEGAEEHFKKMLETTKPLYPLTKVSYSFSLGRLLVLKGEPERARDYLQTAYDLSGDTKFKKLAGEQLEKLAQDI